MLHQLAWHVVSWGSGGNKPKQGLHWAVSAISGQNSLRRFQQCDLDSKLPALQIRSDICVISDAISASSCTPLHCHVVLQEARGGGGLQYNLMGAQPVTARKRPFPTGLACIIIIQIYHAYQQFHNNSCIGIGPCLWVLWAWGFFFNKIGFLVVSDICSFHLLGKWSNLTICILFQMRMFNHQL